MKRYLTVSLIAVALVGMLSFNGCILDALNSYTVNIPITSEYNITSALTSYTKTDTIDLSNSSTYQRYMDKIKNVWYLTADFRTKSVTPPDLSANITLTLKDKDGNFNLPYSLGSIKPADYMKTPYQLKFNMADIQVINSYLSLSSNKVFIATISISNVSSSQLTYNLDAVVDIVFSANTKL